MRPDEIAAEAEIERASKRDQTLKRGVKTAASLAGGAVGAGIASKVAPFLSEYVPIDLAVKGISKVSPKLGSFLKEGIGKGLNAKEGLAFLKEKITQSAPQEETPAELDPYQVLANYDPKLSDLFRGLVDKGWTPEKPQEIAALKYGAYAKPIAKMENDMGKNFISIVKDLFGKRKSKAALQQQPTDPNQTAQPQQQGGGQGKEALMQILQRLAELRQGRQ